MNTENRPSENTAEPCSISTAEVLTARGSKPEETVNVEAALAVLDGKWKVLILWHLKDAPQRPSELRRRLPLISEKMLLASLRELERDGIVARTTLRRFPPLVEYACSEYGKTFTPLIRALELWGRTHRARASRSEPQ